MQKLEERRINAHKLKPFWKRGFRCITRGGNSMIIYVIVALVLLLDLINPKLLWYLDFWRYKGGQTRTFSYLDDVKPRFCRFWAIALSDCILLQNTLKRILLQTICPVFNYSIIVYKSIMTISRVENACKPLILQGLQKIIKKISTQALTVLTTSAILQLEQRKRKSSQSPVLKTQHSE